MRKLSIISLSILGVGLAACGSKENDFKTAINAQIIHEPQCLTATSMALGLFSYDPQKNQDELKKLSAKTESSFVIVQSFDKNGKDNSYNGHDYSDKQKKTASELDALVNIGLLSKSTERLFNFGLGNSKPNGSYSIYTIYTLTDAGKATTKIDDMTANFLTDPMGNSGRWGKTIVCYARPEVDKIENYREDGNSNSAEIKFSYKYTNIADWATKPEIQALFPEIAETLNNPDKTSTQVLTKTNKGWVPYRMFQ
ncbi:MAG: hypothetical protein KBD25_05110 [Rickettsiaceae bacterium]|jgi:hypothetical protein|nr:hypothetical protein [Rickettsiaceae bacterium]HCY39363.1 hypothetical protein [Neisseriales bacterium]